MSAKLFGNVAACLLVMGLIGCTTDDFTQAPADSLQMELEESLIGQTAIHIDDDDNDEHTFYAPFEVVMDLTFPSAHTGYDANRPGPEHNGSATLPSLGPIDVEANGYGYTPSSGPFRTKLLLCLHQQENRCVGDITIHFTEGGVVYTFGVLSHGICDGPTLATSSRVRYPIFLESVTGKVHSGMFTGYLEIMNPCDLVNCENESVRTSAFVRGSFVDIN